MSAAEIIEQIKVLPQGEFQEVAKFIDEFRREDGAGTDRRDQVRPGFHETARQIFDRYDDLFRELAK